MKEKSTNMSGNTNIVDTSEHVLEIMLWVIHGYIKILETEREENMMSCPVCQKPPACVVMLTLMMHLIMFGK